MNRITTSQIVLVMATLLFVAWTLLNTVCWPVENYGNVTHAYTESTNQIVRGMSIGIAGYLSVLGVVIGLNLTKPAKA